MNITHDYDYKVDYGYFVVYLSPRFNLTARAFQSLGRNLEKPGELSTRLVSDTDQRLAGGPNNG